MNNVAIAFSTKDRTELSCQSVLSLLRPDLFDLYWVDGSDTIAGQALPNDYLPYIQVRANVRGGADAAIVYGLTELLKNPRYDYVGLVENDVLLHPDWFGPTMALFQRGEAEGLHVGAVSARCYEDRILIQRDGYAVCHNLGAGMIIFTRRAAEIALSNFRTTFTSENRQTFGQLSGLDIGRWWAFRSGEHWLTADWGIEKTLAQCGLAALALTPSPVEMIGQVPSLAEQGLTLATQPVELLRNDQAFTQYRDTLQAIALHGIIAADETPWHQDAFGITTIFPHQLLDMPNTLIDNEFWSLQWCQGFGPFAYRSLGPGVSVGPPWATLSFEAIGPVDILVSGASELGVERHPKIVSISDSTGFSCKPPVSGPSILSIAVPSNNYTPRVVTIIADEGVVFYGLRMRCRPLYAQTRAFTHDDLPAP